MADSSLINPLCIESSGYKAQREIGKGSFGVLYEGINMQDGNRKVAIKFEYIRSDAPQLKDEYRAYKILKGTKGVPNAYYYGSHGNSRILVIDLLGKSLEDLFASCGRRFSVKTVAMLAKEMVKRIESVHEHDLIYRDIKPDNFLIGGPYSKNAENDVFLIDYGMVKQYRDPKTKVHIPYRERKNLSGTARYMSINTHLGREQSRRDDLESLGHVFLYFLRGNLPWQGIKAATNKQKYEKIGEKKQSTSIEDLCKYFPEQFAHYMRYVRNLRFEETPDYAYLYKLFDDVLAGISEKNDGIYDWMRRSKVRSQRLSTVNPFHDQPLYREATNSNLRLQTPDRSAEFSQPRMSGVSKYEHASVTLKTKMNQHQQQQQSPPARKKRGFWRTICCCFSCGPSP